MADDLRRLRPSPVALFLIALLLVVGLVIVKKQRWHSPRPADPTPAAVPEAVGPSDGTHLYTAPAMRVLLRSSRQPLDPDDDEGWPCRVEVVQHGDRHLRVCHLDLERYVAQVVTHELPASWGEEVKKAQAVAARSYALTELDPDAPYDIRASALAQNFRTGQPDPGAVAATEATRGVVLTQDGRIVRAFYHACCGGQTVSPREFWGMHFPRIPSVECEYCAAFSLYRWTHETTREELGERLGLDVEDVWVESADSTGRATRVAIETPEQLVVMTGEEFRAAVGFTRLRSTGFGVAIDGETVRFDGRGSGHGVGMCQWGARGMSVAGFGWAEILGFYYPGSAIEEDGGVSR